MAPTAILLAPNRPVPSRLKPHRRVQNCALIWLSGLVRCGNEAKLQKQSGLLLPRSFLHSLLTFLRMTRAPARQLVQSVAPETAETPQ
jgi:hypothetical protein